jgi:hypothetical protein
MNSATGVMGICSKMAQLEDLRIDFGQFGFEQMKGKDSRNSEGEQICRAGRVRSREQQTQYSPGYESSELTVFRMEPYFSNEDGEQGLIEDHLAYFDAVKFE